MNDIENLKKAWELIDEALCTMALDERMRAAKHFSAVVLSPSSEVGKRDLYELLAPAVSRVKKKHPALRLVRQSGIAI